MGGALCAAWRGVPIENGKWKMEKDVGAFGDGFQAWPEDIRQRTVPCLTEYIGQTKPWVGPND